MPISIICTGCKKKLTVPDTAAGKKVRCPSCQAVIAVPAAEEFVEPEDDFVEPDEETAVAEAPLPAKKKPAARKRRDAEDDDGYGLDEEAEEEREDLERRRKKKEKRRRRDDDEDRRRAVLPHRGVLILVIGILAIATGIIPILGWLFGAIALRMARADLPEMASGRMDRSGEGLTQAGNVCGYIGILLGLLSCIAGGAMRTMMK